MEGAVSTERGPQEDGDRRIQIGVQTYNRSSNLGIFGRRLPNSLLPPKERVLGVRYNGAATAFTLKDIRQAGLVQTEVGGVPIVLASTGPNLPVVGFGRSVGGRVLTFNRTEVTSELMDAETHSRWRMSDGVAVDGRLKDARLQRVVTYPAFWFGWVGFFPRSSVWKP